MLALACLCLQQSVVQQTGNHLRGQMIRTVGVLCLECNERGERATFEKKQVKLKVEKIKTTFAMCFVLRKEQLPLRFTPIIHVHRPHLNIVRVIIGPTSVSKIAIFFFYQWESN